MFVCPLLPLTRSTSVVMLKLLGVAIVVTVMVKGRNLCSLSLAQYLLNCSLEGEAEGEEGQQQSHTHVLL